MPIAIPKGTHHRTKQEFVYQTLRTAIMRCDLGPGERLVIDDLARRLGVSIIPVREALQMLQSEALVVLVPHVGATVATISKDSIVDVFTMLEGLETVGTRLAAERATPADHSRLIALVGEMEDVLRHERYEDWPDLNARFHLTIARIPGLAMLEEMTARVLTCWDRVRRYYFKDVLVHRLVQAQREHHDMLEAITSCNLPALEALVRRHNQGALQSYIEYVNSTHPDEWPQSNA